MNKDLPLFDIQQCTALLGSEKQAKQMMQIFMDELPQHQTQIKQYATDETASDLSDTLHAIIGASSYCGMPLLHHQLKQTHQTIKTSDTAKNAHSVRVLLKTIDLMLQTWQSTLDTF